MKKYYSLDRNTETNSADIYIYGDITSYPWLENETSSYNLSKELQELNDVEEINVYINSFGGEVAEGLAIYNALKRHKAKVTTITDGFACSIASVIFAAGDERLMSDASLLMIHNAWTQGIGNSNDLRKQADDLEKITQASVNAYLSVATVEEDAIKEMMDEETWIDGVEAKEMGFATGLVESKEKQVVTQSVRNSLLQKVTQEPEKIIAAKVKMSKGDMQEIVAEELEKISLKLTKDQELEDEKYLEMLKQEQKTEDTENKPKKMIQALFNPKEEL